MNERPLLLLLRSLVMLACLFGVPLLAMLGPAATTWRSPRLLAADNRRDAAHAPAPQEAALFSRNKPAGDAAAGISANPAGREPSARESARRGPEGVARGAALARSAEIAIPGPVHRPNTYGQRVLPPHDFQPGPGPGGDPRPMALRAAQRAQDYLDALTERLRDLGAGYYLLECWGEQEKVYRFFCKMGPRQGPGVSFEAVASDQISAVERVLDQAETWRTGSPPASTASGPRGNLR